MFKVKSLIAISAMGLLFSSTLVFADEDEKDIVSIKKPTFLLNIVKAAEQAEQTVMDNVVENVDMVKAGAKEAENIDLNCNTGDKDKVFACKLLK